MSINCSGCGAPLVIDNLNNFYCEYCGARENFHKNTITPTTLPQAKNDICSICKNVHDNDKWKEKGIIAFHYGKDGEIITYGGKPVSKPISLLIDWAPIVGVLFIVKGILILLNFLN